MRRIPDHVKHRRGTARADRPARRRPQPPAGVPTADPTWPESVQRRYDVLVKALGDAVSVADAGVLEIAARAQAEADELDRILQVEGLTYRSGRNGMRRPNPAVALRADAQRRALSALRALGLSPTDRSRVEAIESRAFDWSVYGSR